MKILLFLWAFFLPLQVCWAESLHQHVNRLISSGGFIVTAGGKPIVQLREHSPFIPASTIKLATALIALEILGPSHRFKTEFYLLEETVLFVKGYGDPFLTSEFVADIASALKTRGVRTVSELVLDDTVFELPNPAPGNKNSTNPYDAPNSALAVNFNALPLLKHGTGIVDSGEVQTPLLPLMQAIGKDLKPGRYRLNVAAFPERDGLSNSLRYTAELFTALLRAEGIEVGHSIRHGHTDNRAGLIYTHYSRKTVADLVQVCLKYSSNYIANQLFLASGAKVFGVPATWQKARRAELETLSAKLSIDINTFALDEGSGLSRRNRTTADFLISVLESFKPYTTLLPETDGILLKSGTLKGVYCYAGYFTSGLSIDPFVLLLNQPHNTRKELLFLLQKEYMAYMRQQQNLTPATAAAE